MKPFLFFLNVTIGVLLLSLKHFPKDCVPHVVFLNRGIYNREYL